MDYASVYSASKCSVIQLPLCHHCCYIIIVVVIVTLVLPLLLCCYPCLCNLWPLILMLSGTVVVCGNSTIPQRKDEADLEVMMIF